MSNWGIGLLFSFGKGAQPEILVLRDVEAACGACGHEVLMRYYDALPFHTLTTGALRAMLERAHAPFAGTCTQCDAPATEEHVQRWVVHYGFPSMRGLIQGFADTAGQRRWLLSLEETIDVQLVPRWDTPHHGRREEVNTLTEAAVQDVFGRAFNGKALARTLVADAAGGLHGLSPTHAVAIHDAPLSETELRERFSLAPDAVVAPWCEGHDVITGFAGAPDVWLSEIAPDTHAWGIAYADQVLPAAEHIVSTFPVEMTFVQTGDEITLQWAESPAAAPVLNARDIAMEAARTATHVADITRLEIDRLLLGLTGLWTAEEDAE